MIFTKALLLGLVQGLTEFLPISSSGHLVIVQHLLGIKQPPIMFDILVHLATLVAILLVFQKEIREINRNLVKAILIGLIPTGIIGLLLNSITDILFSSLTLVGISLMATSLILVSTKFLKKPNQVKTANITTKTALFIGTAQGLAVIPGISRSGTTIVAGLWLGLNKKKAVSFSFLLAIPAIIGALILQFKEPFVFEEIYSLSYLGGFITALISGWLTLKALKVLVEESKLHYFAVYTFLLATLLLFS